MIGSTAKSFARFLAALSLVSLHAGAAEDWARPRLNDGSGVSTRAFSYPATTQPVRLYLIDTAVKRGNNAWGNWFKRNPKLSFSADSDRVAAGTAAAFEHGTKMLSIIAGPEPEWHSAHRLKW